MAAGVSVRRGRLCPIVAIRDRRPGGIHSDVSGPARAEIAGIEKVLALYVGKANSPTVVVAAEPVHPSNVRRRVSAAPGQKPGPRISPQRQAAIEATTAILKQATRPLKTAALYEMISDMGVSIGGADPVNNYSALLYGREEFQSHGREGWTLKEEASDA